MNGALPFMKQSENGRLLFVYQAGAFLLAGKSFQAIELHLQDPITHSEGETTAKSTSCVVLMAAFRSEAKKASSYRS